MTYSIVSWIYLHEDDIGEEYFKNPELLKERLKSSDIDKTGSVAGWIENSDWLTDKWIPTPGDMHGKNTDDIQTRIDIFNEDYESEIKGEIDAATTEEEINAIKLDMSYQENTINSINISIESRLEEIKKLFVVDEDTIETVREKAEKATNYEQLDKLDRDFLEKKGVNEATISEIIDIIKQRSDEIDSLEETFLKKSLAQIESAGSLSDLEKIDLSASPVTGTAALYDLETKLENKKLALREQLGI